MGITLESTGAGDLTIHVESVLTPAESHFGKFQEVVDEVLRLVPPNAFVDLAKCRYIDTQAISILLTLSSELKKKGVTLQICNASAEIQDFLRSIQLDQIITLRP